MMRRDVFKPEESEKAASPDRVVKEGITAVEGAVPARSHVGTAFRFEKAEQILQSLVKSFLQRRKGGVGVPPPREEKVKAVGIGKIAETVAVLHDGSESGEAEPVRRGGAGRERVTAQGAPPEVIVKGGALQRFGAASCSNPEMAVHANPTCRASPLHVHAAAFRRE